ncbi:MAG: zinc-ribbon domain-containing protein [Dehalococcoidales bacterium]|nr:zinc-ribbon domain-containing protein [Dehalococcoidales bacterium]
MFCTNCGKKLLDDSRFCEGCGTRLHSNAAPEVPVEKPAARPTTRKSEAEAFSENTEYVKKDEVRRVCGELGLADWSTGSPVSVTDEDAARILRVVNVKGMDIPVEDFRLGLEVELEHGTRYEDANVTNNHPVLTGKIVLAHLKEAMDYYQRLDVAEVEGDLLKAILDKDLKKIEVKYRKTVEAQDRLNKAVSRQLKS